MSTTLPHGIIQINEGNIAWYGDITANWQLIDDKIGIYDAAIASIPAPANNGTLTINYGGSTLAMFGADDAGNVSADIPAPGDGTLKVTQGGSTLGTFSANQATPEAIDIPAPGDGTLTIQLNGVDVQTFTANQSGNATANIVTPAINNGTLTIRLNGVDVQTFTANQANDVVADIIPPVPGDGTLTIKVNGSTAGTFTANQSTAATANITVPTAVSELTNDSGYLTSSSNLDASKLTSGTVDIARLPQGALERLVKVANEAARYALTTADVQLGDTVQQLDTGIMYVVTDIDHLDSAAGYTEYTAGTAASVPWSGVTGKPTFAAVATSGAYSDLTGTPTIPTVNNATLTIQKNGTTVKTFTANASSNVTANISVPTKTSDLTNDSGFITGVTWNDVSNKPSFATVATSGSYNDLTNKPTIPTVNNATLTIQKNGTTVKTFTANASSNVTANISVPTKTSDLTNDSGFITGVTWNDVSNKPSFATVATSGSYNDLTNKPTIPTVNNATLTIQRNGTTVKTFTANASSNVTANITVPTKTSDLTNDSGFITSDNTKIPLAGSNAISGDLIPSTDNSIDIGSSTNNIKMLYTKGITIDGTQFLPSDYVLPTGSYIQFAGSQAPAGFLVCNGGAISRTTYSKLFAVIGTTYGSGDGSTTFNLPNLTDRFLQGSTSVGTVKDAGLPNIVGNHDQALESSTSAKDMHGSGAFLIDYHTKSADSDSGIHYYIRLGFDASRSNSIYGNSTTVQPPALTCLICIKY